MLNAIRPFGKDDKMTKLDNQMLQWSTAKFASNLEMYLDSLEDCMVM
jgi:hypothetical protein